MQETNTRKDYHRFNFKWNLKDGYPAKGIEYHGKRVFTTFACGGGSTMGYKLAGYDVIGANDIDPQMEKVYKENHHPKFYFRNPINELLKLDLPKELYKSDILDGSPPCSTFSMAGSREKAWKKDKKFREGQAKQVLSDLFFDFIDLAERLKPKVVVAENVKGMIIGNAKAYTKEVLKRFNEIGYEMQLFLLNAASMGVPQKRERVFFIGYRKDLKLPKLEMSFSENKILFREFADYKGNKITDHKQRAFDSKKQSDRTLAQSKVRAGMMYSDFNCTYAKDNEVLPTITAKGAWQVLSFSKPVHLSKKELLCGGSFPQDYNFLDIKSGYLIGMSVPPVMMAQVSNQVYKQWLK